jgi:hypothetical protein
MMYITNAEAKRTTISGWLPASTLLDPPLSSSDDFFLF